MKKFFSIVCALAIVLSASAMDAKTLTSGKKVDVKELKASVPAKTIKEVKSLKKADRAVEMRRAPQAKKETIAVTATSYTEKYYSFDNDVWVKLYAADGSYYCFDVVVADGTQELALGQAYSYTDMVANYTYMYDADGNKIYFSDASLTKTTTIYSDEDGDQTLVNFVASGTDADGNIYNITYNQAPFIITGDTIELAFTEMMNKPIFADSLVQVRTKTEDHDAAFTYTVATAGSIVGTFAPEDMNLQYTFVDGMEAIEAHCEATENNGTLFVEGWILASDGNVYHVTMFFIVPTVQSQEDVTMTNLAIDDSYASWFGILIASASNDDYSVNMYLDAENYLGTFSADEVELTIADANGEIEIYEGTITVANTADGIVITGSVLAMDGVQYNLNISYVKPEATSQETLTATGKMYIEEYQGYTYWQAQAISADGTRGISLLAFADQPAGSYAAADLYADYCYVGKFVNGDTTWYDMVDATIAIAVSGDVATVTGTFLAQSETTSSDVVEFTLNLTLAVVDETGGGSTGDENDAEEGFYKKFPTYTVDDQYLAQYQVLVVEASDATDNSFISLEFNVAEGTTALAPGVYPINDTYAENTISYGYINQYIYGSVAGYMEGEYVSLPLWLVTTGNATVLANGVIEINAQNTKGASILVRLGTYPEAIENTEAAAGATKRLVNGQLVIEKNGVRYNAVGTILK